MILAANVNNSYISFGIFEQGGECRLVYDFKISTNKEKTVDEYVATVRNILGYSNVELTDFSGAVLCSVIPALTGVISQAIYKLINITPMVVGPGVKTGVSIKIDNPAELGTDLVANAVAVIVENKQKDGMTRASIILDMGMATTIFAIDRAGEYIGGCIFPGVQLLLDSLHGSTALLPDISMVLPERAIGKNSQEALCSGVGIGTAMMIDGFVSRFESEMKCKAGEVKLFATGEHAEGILQACSHSFIYEPFLTLKGLYYIYRKNH